MAFYSLETKKYCDWACRLKNLLINIINKICPQTGELSTNFSQPILYELWQTLMSFDIIWRDRCEFLGKNKYFNLHPYNAPLTYESMHQMVSTHRQRLRVRHYKDMSHFTSELQHIGKWESTSDFFMKWRIYASSGCFFLLYSHLTIPP